MLIYRLYHVVVKGQLKNIYYLRWTMSLLFFQRVTHKKEISFEPLIKNLVFHLQANLRSIKNFFNHIKVAIKKQRKKSIVPEISFLGVLNIQKVFI